MNKQEFINQIKSDFNINDTKDIESKIDIYIQMLNEYNEKFNLTRLNKEEIIYDQYFYESIFVYKKVNFFDGMTILDIGSGSGIPGVVLKILFPFIKLTIIEPMKKRCLFLDALVKSLGFEDVTIINERAEIFGKRHRELFDLVTCRAVAELKVIIEISFPLAKSNGLIVFPKSQNYEIELENAKNILEKIGNQKMEILKQSFNNKNFFTFYFCKIGITPKVYPREWKDIIK